jgi:4-hydroxy-tetrahydrodipicolinate reductase
MGRIVVGEVLDTPGCRLAGGADQGDAVGRDLGELIGRGRNGVAVTGDAAALFALAEAVIDFSAPAAAAGHAALAAERRVAYVVGTTGLTPEQESGLRQAAVHAPVVWAPNMSVGINLLLSLVERVAGVLDAATFDAEIVEMHHRHKVDAPSGTALALGRAVATGRGVRLEEVWQKSRDGVTGARRAGAIGFASLRGGDVVGDHSVIFAADGERLEITHKASSRLVFAKGAVRAACWAARRPPGLYSMRDVLGL